MNKPFARRADTIAARAIAHLRTHPEGTSVRAGVLADAIDSEASVISATFAPYIRSGEIVVRKEGRNNCYSLGKGVAPPAPGGSEPDDADETDTPQQRTTKAEAGSAPKGAVSSVFGLGGPPRDPSTWKAAKTARKPRTPRAVTPPSAPARRAKPRKPKPPEAAVLNNAIAARVSSRAVATTVAGHVPSGLECALFNTGALHIEVVDGQSMRLTRDQVRDLVAYLDRIANAAEPA